MPATRLDLLVVGDCNPDVLVTGDDVTPVFGQQEKLVGGMQMVIGGSAAITAVAAARLGLRVALAAVVGSDAAGNFMLAELTREGVDISPIVVRPGAPTAMTIALSRGGDRAILTSIGAAATLTDRDVPAQLLSRAQHVHVSSYFLLENCLGPGLAGLFAAAHAAGATTSLDTNWDPAQRWGDDRLRAAMAQADLLLPNEAEALALSGKSTLDDAVAALAGPRLVIKLGPAGALCADGSRRYRIQPPELRPVDTTGAGDCFNAGLLAGLASGLDLPEAAALGCAVGGASTQAAGGTASAPTLPEAQALARKVTVRPAD